MGKTFYFPNSIKWIILVVLQFWITGDAKLSEVFLYALCVWWRQAVEAAGCKNWRESFRIALQPTNIVLYICLLNKKYKFEKVKYYSYNHQLLKHGKARYGLGVESDIILIVQYWQLITEMHNKFKVGWETNFP